MAQTANGPELLAATKELAQGKNFASVCTMLPSGRMQNHVLWAGLEDGQLVLNTETHRVKYLNVTKDPRITVLIRDEQDPYRYAEVRGEITATTTGDRARAHIDELADTYIGRPYPPEAIKSERVMLWVRPERQTVISQNEGTGTED